RDAHQSRSRGRHQRQQHRASDPRRDERPGPDRRHPSDARSERQHLQDGASYRSERVHGYRRQRAGAVPVKGALAVTFAMITAAGTAQASGLYVGDIGTRGMARAGAFIASPDSLLALHYNPAGLALLSGFQMEF